MSKISQYASLATGVLDRIVRPRISKVTIPITYECNQRCKTCDIWRINKDTPVLRDKEMTLEEFREFLKVNSLLWVALTGGEPFLKPDIHLFLQEALKNCKLVSITTNGFNGKKIWYDTFWNCLRGLEGNSVLAVNVSFEGPSSLHDEVAGVRNSYQKALDTYRRLYHVGKDRDSRLRVGISYTTSHLNQGRFWDFAEGMKGEFPGVEGVTYGIGQEADYYSWQGPREVPPEILEVRRFVGEVCSRFSRGLNPFNWVAYKYLDGLRNGKEPPKCVAGQYSVMLDPYWNVYPCMFFCPTTPIGNLREVGFDLKRIDFEKCKELVDNCKGCWTPCEAYSTIVFRPWRIW